MSAPYAAIVLAAGFSSRMKGFKPLLPLGDTTLAGHLIATLQRAGADVFLVTGYRRNEIKDVVRNPGITIVENPDYEQGMLSSVKAGLRSLPAGYRGVLVQPVDIPLVRTETVRQLLEAADAAPGRIIFPVFQGERGHPPLIPSDMIPAVLEWQEAGGLRAFLYSQLELIRELLVADSYIRFDVDTVEDYRLLLERYRQG